MPEDEADELSQAEIESLLSQASELTTQQPADGGREDAAASSSESSIFAGGLSPADLASLDDDSIPQERIMTADEASEVLGDVPVEISIELGRVKLTIGELMDLRRGAVVDLDRLAGEPVDVLANGTVVARGEVVLVNDYYSVRITDIVDEDQ